MHLLIFLVFFLLFILKHFFLFLSTFSKILAPFSIPWDHFFLYSLCSSLSPFPKIFGGFLTVCWTLLMSQKKSTNPPNCEHGNAAKNAGKIREVVNNSGKSLYLSEDVSFNSNSVCRCGKASQSTRRSTGTGNAPRGAAQRAAPTIWTTATATGMYSSSSSRHLPATLGCRRHSDR